MKMLNIHEWVTAACLIDYVGEGNREGKNQHSNYYYYVMLCLVQLY